MATPTPAPEEDGVRPLAGLRILAVEQMQALPFATQLLGRLGAEVVKVERPSRGDMARGSQPAASIDGGVPMGATFLRNNAGKRSITIDLKHPQGRELLLALVPRFDVIAENSRAGVMDRLGLGWADVSARHPNTIYVSVSGFGNRGDSPYRDWPALAPVVEAMTGVYGMSTDGPPPRIAPLGAIGDISAALFATIGILTAVVHRDRTGQGQYVDIAMLDSMIAMTDIVANLWSLGLRDGSVGPLIMHSFRASDGWFVLQVTRGAPVRCVGGTARPARLARRRALHHAPRVGDPPRERDPACHRAVGREPHQDRSRRRARSPQAPRRAVPVARRSRLGRTRPGS